MAPCSHFDALTERVIYEREKNAHDSPALEMDVLFCSKVPGKRCRSPPLVLRFRQSTKIKEDKPMAKPYRIPDFRKLYPEASEEVIAVLRTTERKMQYQEYDLKTEQTTVDQDGQTVTVIPSREDSYERLLEKDEQFAEDAVSVEELALKNLQLQQLHKALTFLSDDERDLIDRLFFREQTEREIATEYGLSQNAINKRRKRVLDKLRTLLEKS